MTIIFADVVGSTSLAETMDAEDWRGVISLLFGRAAPVVARYEGTIARILGDALLIYFGAPVAHEDDPVRAIRAALDLLDVVREVGPELDSRYGVRLQMRVGIHTGPVVVGELGGIPVGGLASEYVALGDAMNLAARIESTAQPMTVYVSDDTYRLAAPLFTWEDRGSFELKGKREPVHLWQAVGRRTGQTTSLRGFVGLEAPMVGRDGELARLLEATGALRDEGAGAIVTITGEPGIGKTRLTSEWRARATRVPNALGWLTGSCLSYGRRLAYHAIVDLLRSSIGASETSEDEELRSRLSGAVASYLGGSPEAAAVLADLLSLELLSEERQILETLDSQARQARYVRTIGALLRRRAQERPTVALIEDVHWADPTSVLILRRLLPIAAEAPILFCLTSRPEVDAPAWSLLSELDAIAETPRIPIELEPLVADQTGALVRALLDAAGVTGADEETVLAHAEGNPLFAEEIVRMLIERADGGDAPTPDAAEGNIPDTIHGLLLARLDTLPTPVRRTARLAAVAGRRFSVRLLEEVRAG
jgi:class 3 adenylate cyclase